MGLRFFCRNFRLSSGVNRLTSNFEVFQEIPTTKQATLAEIDIVELDQYKTKNLRKKYVMDLNKYLNSKPCLKVLKGVIPTSVFSQKPSTTRNVFLPIIIIDKDVACDMFKAMKPHLEKYNGHILEINAGAGVLTEILIKARLKNLRIYEPDATLCNYLLEMIKNHKSDARLFFVNLLKLGIMTKQDRSDNGCRVDTVFNGLQSKNWEDEPVTKVIAALPHDRFILHLMFSIILQSGLFKFGRPELFFVLPQQAYDKLKASPNKEKLYRAKSVIFQVFFEDEILLRLPAEAFIPWFRADNKKHQDKDVDNELFFLKITPRKDLLHCIPQNMLKPFWYFVKVFMHKKSSLLIENMERFIPGSGVRLIAKGYTIFTDCGSLTPDEYVNLFLEFSSWPEFHSCSFLPNMDNLLATILEYGITEEALNEKCNLLTNKESEILDSNVEVFECSENLEHSGKSVSVEETSL